MAVNGAVTLSNTLAVTGTSAFTGNVATTDDVTCAETVFAKNVTFSQTGAVVTDVASYTTNDYTATGLADASVLQINPNARNIELTGLVAPTNLVTFASGGRGAKLLYLQNAGGTYKITLSHANVLSVAANRFVGVGNADIVIPAGGAVTLLYTVEEARWRALGQVQPHVTREQTVVSAATLTPNADEDDIVSVTAQAGSLVIANPSPAYTVVQGQKLIIRLKDDNTTGRNIDWTTSGSQYRAIQSALPDWTTKGKVTYLGFIYNATDTKWDLVANAQEA
jgi:hypothetical protein